MWCMYTSNRFLWSVAYIHAYIIHIHAYIHTYIHTCIHTCIHAYMHTCIHAYIHTYIHTYIHAYIHTYIHQDSPVVSRKAKKKQHTRATYATTDVLFTATNAVKFASTVTWSSWVLSLNYYRANTFLSCRTSKLKTTEFGATVVKNQQF